MANKLLYHLRILHWVYPCNWIWLDFVNSLGATFTGLVLSISDLVSLITACFTCWCEGFCSCSCDKDLLQCTMVETTGTAFSLLGLGEEVPSNSVSGSGMSRCVALSGMPG